MTLLKVLLSALAATLIGFGAPQEMFDLTVERVRTLRDQPGDLHVDAQGVTFQSKDGKTNSRRLWNLCRTIGLRLYRQQFANTLLEIAQAFSPYTPRLLHKPL